MLKKTCAGFFVYVDGNVTTHMTMLEVGASMV